MSGAEFLHIATLFGLAALGLALVLSIVRIALGPTLPDRILALDLLTVLGLGFIAVLAIRTDQMLYLDIAIALALVGFLATVAFSRYVLRRGLAAEAARRERAEILERATPDEEA